MKIRAKTVGKSKSPMKKRPKTQERPISVGVSEGKTPKTKKRQPSKKKTVQAGDEIPQGEPKKKKRAKSKVAFKQSSQEIQESKAKRSKSKKAKKRKLFSDAGSLEIQESKPKRSKSKKAKESIQEEKPKTKLISKKCRIGAFQHKSDIAEKIRAKTMSKGKFPLKKKPMTRETISVEDSEGESPKLKKRKSTGQQTYPVEDEI